MGKKADRFGEIRGDFYSQGSYDYWKLGHYYRTSDGGDLKVYFGEIYVDNTLARVEIGNAPVFGDCTHREIQIPVSWDSNNITFTGNQGTFQDGEQVYLFVVNEFDVASAGFPVTLGDGSPIEGPGMPGQPVLNPSP